MKANKKILSLSIGILILVFAALNSSAVLAGPLDTNIVNPQTQMNAFNTTAGYNANSTIGPMVATVIKAFLGLLGIIFIFLMVLAGYHWMTAAGDEQKVTKAKDTMRTAVIGLIIIVAAYSITYFVFKSLSNTAGTGATAPSSPLN